VGRTLPWVYSVALHAVLIVLLSVSYKLHEQPAAALPTAVAVQATVVDEARIQKELDALAANDRKQAQEQQRQAQQAEAARKAREAEEKRLAQVEQQRKDAEAEAARKSEEARKQQEELQAQQEAEQAQLAKIEEDRKKEEARLAAVAKERADAEARAKQEADARKQRELEAQLKDALAQEEERQQAEQSGKLAQYIEIIRQKVERNWVRPASATAGLSCDVQVSQIPGGEVVKVTVGTCNGDAAVMRSIEAAVQKSSPLPPPPDPSLFERELLFKFEPE
jgi:colicin import membrane protein